MERWKQNLYVVGIAQFMGFCSLAFVMSFLPLYIKTLGVTDPGSAAVWSGILMGTAAFFAAISGPVWGSIGDRRGRKAMVERVLLANTVLISFMAFASSPWHLLILRSFQGALGGFAAASIALVTSITPEGRIGFALGFYQFAMTAGVALGPLLGGYLADTLSFSAAFLVMAGLSLASVILVRFYVYEKFTPPKPNQKSQGFFETLKHLLSNRTLLAMLMVNFMVQYSLVIATPIIPLFIQSLDPGSSRITTMTGLIIAAGGTASALSAIFLGKLSDRIGHRKILIICALGAAAANLLQVPVSSTWQFLALRIIGGLFTGGMLPSSNALISNLIPSEHRGTAFGVATSFSLLGNVFGPISGGLLGASQLGYRGVFSITAGMLLLTTLWIKAAVKPPAGTGQKLFT